MDRGVPFIIENSNHAVSKAIFNFAEEIKDQLIENDQVEEDETED